MGAMTRAQAEERREHLRRRIGELEAQLLSVDAASASMSVGSGSVSYTNRSVADLKERLAFARRELARVEWRLGLRARPGSVVHIVPRYVG